ESALKALNELNGYILPSGKVMKIDVYINRNTIPDSNMISSTLCSERNSDYFDEINASKIHANQNTLELHSFKRIFIHNLKDEISTDRELQLLFHRFGVIIETQIYKKNGKPLGCAHIEFASSESALKAVEEMNGYKLPSGRTIIVRQYFEMQPNASGINNRFHSTSSSEWNSRNSDVFNDDNENNVSDTNSDVTLDLSEGISRLSFPDISHQPSTRNIYVTGFKDEINSDSELQNLFERFGTITSSKCVINKNEYGQFNKSYGYVCYDDEHSARFALQAMDGFYLASGNTIRVSRNLPKEQVPSNASFNELNTSSQEKPPMQKIPAPAIDNSTTDAIISKEIGQKELHLPVPLVRNDEYKIQVANFADAISSDRELECLFQKYGNILKTTLLKEKKIGIISFDNAISVHRAVSKMSGCLLSNGRRLIVTHYLKLVDTLPSNTETTLNKVNFPDYNEKTQIVEPTLKNLFSTKIIVKNYSSDVITEQQLCFQFSEFGPIKCAKIMKDEDGKPRGIAVIRFYRHESALKAITVKYDEVLPNGKCLKVERFLEQSEVKQRLRNDFLTRFKENKHVNYSDKCFVCTLNVAKGEIITLNCRHQFCRNCIEIYITYLMDKYEVESILCPLSYCSTELNSSFLRELGNLFYDVCKRQKFIRQNSFTDETCCPRYWCREPLPDTSQTQCKCMKCCFEFCIGCGNESRPGATHSRYQNNFV
ncbi:polyadenylate-binding protein 6-like protein, partial [Leptotrombidium deliense]